MSATPPFVPAAPGSAATTSLSGLFTSHHRHCDEAFASAEKAAAAGDWPAAEAAFDTFSTDLLAHFATEEEQLFPAFESATGMTGGPTAVMRHEHVQMRGLVANARQALADHDGDAFLGEADTLLILMEQHNLKEENILYPMCDAQLAGQAAELLPRCMASLQSGA